MVKNSDLWLLWLGWHFGLEDWGTRIKDAGGDLVADGVAILGEPDDDGNAQCQELE